MKQTSNYNLPILEAGDKYLKDYQNDAFSVIDTELKAMNDKINTLDNVEGSILETGRTLGIGNSANATTPGNVVAKFEILNENGVSLGYVPIYDRID